VEAIERYVTTMEEGTAPLGESVRALAFWFRDKRDRWINSAPWLRWPGARMRWQAAASRTPRMRGRGSSD
jgi:hypothetical protein